MLFNSYGFILLFLPATLLGARLLSSAGPRAAGIWILLASLFFYAYWDARFLPLLVGSILVNFFAARIVSQTRSLFALILAISVNLGLLAYFKYLGFFSEIASSLLPIELTAYSVILPLAISFFTFQQIGYQVDCWRGNVTSHHFLDYALFISFFPQLIAGPIVRQNEFLPQASRLYAGPRERDLGVGLTFFAIGLFKKVVVADTFAGWATPIFDSASSGESLGLTAAWLGALCYTFQIYFDFSGYADMAVGLGRMFGIRLPINFNAPYRARSITEFWRRWHITLGRFLRDYLYIPLGGNRLSPSRHAANLVLVMLLAGLWHGAAWTFVIWGGMHGLAMAILRLRQRLSGQPAEDGPIRDAVCWAGTFLFLVVTWVFFRADNVDAALAMLLAMAGLSPNGMSIGEASPLAWLFVALALGWVLLLPTSHQLMRRQMRSPMYRPYLVRDAPVPRPAWRPNLGWTVASAAIFAMAVLGLHRASEFIYYQF